MSDWSPMTVIGLTGGVATGKSTVAAMIRERGVPVIDADVIARELMAPGTPLLEQVVQAFGSDVLTADGHLDRPAMRQRIIDDPAARQRLDALTHPAIAEAIDAQLRALRDDDHPIVFVEAALMVETGSRHRYDQLWVVTCAPNTQLARLAARDGTSQENALGLIRTQLPLTRKVSVADQVLYNDGEPGELRSQVHAALDALKTERGS